MDERGQIRDSRNCLRSEGIFFGCSIRPMEKAIGRRSIHRVPPCPFLWRGTLQQFGQDWNKWNAIIEAFSGRLVWGLCSSYRLGPNFIELDLVAEEGELRSKRFFFGKAAENICRHHRTPFAYQCSPEKPAVNRVAISQDLDVAGVNCLCNTFSRNGSDRCRQVAQRGQRLCSEVLVAHEGTSSAIDPADRNIQITHDPFLEGANQCTIDHVMRQIGGRLSLTRIRKQGARDRGVLL